MSAVPVPTRNPEVRTRPNLRPVAGHGPDKLALLPFALLVVVVLGVGLGGIIVLNTAIQEQSRALSRAQREATQLSYQEASLVTEVGRLRSPGNLAAEAVKLGMVPNPHAAFIKLPSGEILGTPTRVKGDEVTGILQGGREVPRPQVPAKPADKRAGQQSAGALASPPSAPAAEAHQQGAQAAPAPAQPAAPATTPAAGTPR